MITSWIPTTLPVFFGNRSNVPHNAEKQPTCDFVYLYHQIRCDDESGFVTPVAFFRYGAKATISLKRVKLTMEGLWQVTNALSNGTIPDSLQPPLPQDWGSQPRPHAQNSNRYYPRNGSSYGLQISLELWRKGKREKGKVSRDSPIFKVPPIISERVKLGTSNFVRTFIESIGTKTITNFGWMSSVRPCVKFRYT